MEMIKHEIPKGSAWRVAVIVTEYRYNSHADVILGRLLGDFDYKPKVEVVSIYTDQVPDNDMSRAEAARCEVPIYSTIAETIKVPYAENGLHGIIIIGEHGDYPEDELGCKHYPRKRLLEETLQALDELNLRVPLFSDKHLSYNIEDSVWMFDQLRRRNIPFFGGSSIPHIPPVPAYDPALLADASEWFVLSYSNATEAYGYHGLELMQSLAEKRQGGESGVKAVHTLKDDEVWAAMRRQEWPEDLLLQALSRYPDREEEHPQDSDDLTVLFIVEYEDGCRGYVLQQTKLVRQWGYAFRTRAGEVVSAVSVTPGARPWGHFARLTKMIESFIITGQEPIAPERILMSSGLINYGMVSLSQQKKLNTPMLNVQYSSL